MILTCPQCETRYQADASKFTPPGRKVRCAKCGNVWHQEAPEPEPETVPGTATPEPVATPTPPPGATPEMEPELQSAASAAADSAAPLEQSVVAKARGTLIVEKSPKPESRATQNIGLIAGWIGLVVVILVIGWSALTYRQQIATVWPRAASLYSSLGMRVNTRGLDFTDVAYHRETEDGQQVLAVSGKLVNVSAHDQPVPAIDVTLTDESKHPIYHWRFNSSVQTLRPGQQAAFLTRLSSPPVGARHLELRFAASGG